MRLFNPARACALLLLLPLSQAVPAAEDPTNLPYAARYSIYRNGALTGKVEVDLEWDDDGGRWIVRSEGSGTHGLARLLGARDSEETRGVLRDDRLLPERYRRHTQVAGIDDRWLVDFDRAAGQLLISHDRGTPRELPMAGETVDPLTLKLEMRRRLASETELLGFNMVNEFEIDEQRFRQLPDEWLETSLGCLRTRPVEKIHEGGRRYTRAWHAPALAWIEVRMEHGKTGGNHLEMRISELSFDGEPVSPRPGCAARQQGARP